MRLRPIHASTKVVYSDDSDVTQFRKDMNEQYKIDSYLAKDNNQRITMVDDQAMMFLIMAFVFLFTLPLITVALIAIIIGRKIKQEQKMIGTLSALGYTKDNLCGITVCLPMIPGLAGGIIVTIITKIIQQPYGEMSLTDYEPMPVPFHTSNFDSSYRNNNSYGYLYMLEQHIKCLSS